MEMGTSERVPLAGGQEQERGFFFPTAKEKRLWKFKESKRGMIQAFIVGNTPVPAI